MTFIAEKEDMTKVNQYSAAEWKPQLTKGGVTNVRIIERGKKKSKICGGISSKLIMASARLKQFQ